MLHSHQRLQFVAVFVTLWMLTISLTSASPLAWQINQGYQADTIQGGANAKAWSPKSGRQTGSVWLQNNRHYTHIGVQNFIDNQSSVKAEGSTIKELIPADFEMLVEHYFDGWVLMVGRESDGLVGASANYFDNEGLQNYYVETQKMAQDLFSRHETAEVYIAFRHPLLESELPNAIINAPQQVIRYSLLYIDPQGNDLWFGAERELGNSVLVNYEQLQSEHPDLVFDPKDQRKDGNNRLAGFTQMFMVVNQVQYQALLVDPDVVAVDIGPALALDEAGLGTQSSGDVFFNAPLFVPTQEEIEILDKLK